MPLLGPRARRTPTSSPPRALVALSAVLAASCVEPERESTGTTSEPVIYGDDDRQDVYAFWEEDWAEQAAGFTAAMLPLINIDQSVPGDVFLHGSTLEERGICPDERFADQLTAAWCSATLIAPDLVLTGGNCIDGGVCSQLGFVFDYTMVDEDTPAHRSRAATSMPARRSWSVAPTSSTTRWSASIARSSAAPRPRSSASGPACRSAAASS